MLITGSCSELMAAPYFPNKIYQLSKIEKIASSCVQQNDVGEDLCQGYKYIWENSTQETVQFMIHHTRQIPGNIFKPNDAGHPVIISWYKKIRNNPRANILLLEYRALSSQFMSFFKLFQLIVSLLLSRLKLQVPFPIRMLEGNDIGGTLAGRTYGS